MSELKTEVIFNNGKNTDNGYLIKNPYATVQKIETDLGRKKAMILTNFFTFLGALVTALTFTSNPRDFYIIIIVFRFILGVGVGVGVLI